MAGTAEAVLKYFKCFFLSAEPALPSLPSSSLVIALWVCFFFIVLY